MYANSYDDGTLMNSYIDWSKRLAILHQRTLRLFQEAENMQRDYEESEEVKAVAEDCMKCKGERNNEDEDLATFPHIQDLCPADKRRIAQLVKQLIKCTREMRDAKSELAVSESEKEAMRNQYQQSLDRRETDKKQLEFELCQARTEARELKSRISRALDLLTRQIAAQEKQFVELTETVRDLVREKTRLENVLRQKQSETDALASKLQRMNEILEMQKLLHSKERLKDHEDKVHRACQTQEELPEISIKMDHESIKKTSKNLRIKGKDELDQLSREETLIRDLFFRKLSVEESGTLDIIPVLSKTNL